MRAAATLAMTDGENPPGAATTSAEGWTVLRSEVEYDCGWFTAGYDEVRRPDGEVGTHYWVDPSDAVAVVAVTDEDDLVFVEDYRPRLADRFLSCPGGSVESGESYEAAAARELREETGFDPGTLRHLQTVRPSGWLRSEFAVMYATDLAAGDPDPDDGEFVTVRTLPVEEAFDRARTQPAGAWTLLPLLLARDGGYL